MVGVAITPDGSRAVSVSWDNTLRVWDLQSGQGLHTLEGHSSQVVGVGITPDGSRAVSASHDHTLRVWDLQSGEEIAAFTGETSMNSCAIAQDGQTVIAGDELGRVHLLRIVEADETKPLLSEIKIPRSASQGTGRICN